MEKTIKIRCINTGTVHVVPLGINLEETYKLINLNMPYGCTSAKVNNKVEGLHYVFFGDKDVEFLDITSASGMRTYTRSLFFVLYKAVTEIYPQSKLLIKSSISNGYYFNLENTGEENTLFVADHLRAKMQEIIDANLPFKRITAPVEDAIEVFRQTGLEAKVKLLESYGDIYTNYYTLGDVPDFFYGSLLINTGQIKVFDVVPFGDGLLLRLPDPSEPHKLKPMVNQTKMFNVLQEQHRWQKILGVNTIGEFNEVCKKGKTIDLINVSEALQEKKISNLADQIALNPEIKVILIAGPSSSGKTTFSKRLAVQLMACGKVPVAISLDDYFVDRSDTPKDVDGNYDYEHIDAINFPLLNEHVQSLLSGKEVELPRYNFLTGKSEKSGNTLKLCPEHLIIFEGIHALNPLIIKEIDRKHKFKIYASALTSILLDDHNYIPTTDNRLLRRIVRDYKYRGYSAEETINRWPKVREGEDKWIFPYQEEADVMVNTALLFELAALRQQALPLLEQVHKKNPAYSEAFRLRKFLSYISPISIKALPPTSLLREFMGGSTFKY